MKMGRVRGHLFFPVDLYIVRIMPDELFHAERWAPTTSSELHVHCSARLPMHGLKIGGDGMRIVADEV